ncbi:hypothetical protein Tco_0962509 [Tanacetum coccineum]
MDVEEPVEDEVVHDDEQPHDNSEKDTLTFDDLIGSTVDFTMFVKNRLKKDKITKADLHQLDWNNPEGDRCPFDISKPLPLKSGKEIHCFTYQNKGCKILSVIRLTIDNQFGYGYLKKIVVRRAGLKEYTFREEDFSKLHLNDLEDMFLLYVQGKIHNLTGDEIVALVNALHMFTRSIVIQRRVEYVQLGVESYQKKLNITKP